jgi:hypothetical protein
LTDHVVQHVWLTGMRGVHDRTVFWSVCCVTGSYFRLPYSQYRKNARLHDKLDATGKVLLVRFQVLMDASMKMTAVFDSLVEADRRFRSTCCLHYEGSDFYETTERHIPNAGLQWKIWLSLTVDRDLKVWKTLVWKKQRTFWVRFEVVAAVSMKKAAFWDNEPCSLSCGSLPTFLRCPLKPNGNYMSQLS